MNAIYLLKLSRSLPTLSRTGWMFLLLGLIALVPLQAQVYTGRLELFDQAAVDTFNYTEVNGYLFIGGYRADTSDITDLSPLSSLIKVGGIALQNNLQLSTLTGLENLDSIGSRGGLSISNAPMISSLAPLSNLQHYSSLLIGGTGLTSLSGLPPVSELNGVSISNNPALVDLSALSGLTSIKGSLSIGYNAQLTNLSALSSLTSISWDLTITNNAQLSDLSGFANLTSIGAHFIIDGNPAITSLAAFSNLSTTSASFIFSFAIKDNPSLSEFCGLHTLFSSAYIFSSVYIYLLDISGNGTNPSISDILNNGPCDVDADGIADISDNCPETANADQADNDGDGIGNVCDNCMESSNADQADTDGDGKGDKCDLCADVANEVDADGNGFPDCQECGNNNGNGAPKVIVTLVIGDACTGQEKQKCISSSALNAWLAGVGRPNNTQGYEGAPRRALCPARRSFTDVSTAQTSFELYPNPVSNRLVMDINAIEDTEATVSIFDLSGRIIQQQQVGLFAGQQKLKVDVSALAEGIYQLSLQTGEGIFTEQFVKATY